MFGFNYFALQCNMCPEGLRKKIPPTDSRVREDVRLWEEDQLDKASAAKQRYEDNQRNRRKMVKKMLEREAKEDGKKIDMHQEQDFYTPRFFTKVKLEGSQKKGSKEPKFEYRLIKGEKGYWERRERGDWTGIPRIFDDDCEPFY
mmetsp:Transcript_17862/g.30323  ORF Transcript_17862/g.30323 Transcript_17862/m.30323 type:complete len:145 (+) Transcript_17862:2607-3041(+)